MTDDEITEAGRKARFEKWEQLGLDQVKHDLLNGGHRVVGGPPQVRALAWEWVRQKEAAAHVTNAADRLTSRQTYTTEAAGAVYAAIEGLVRVGKRAYSLSVPIEAENILVGQVGGTINRAAAHQQVRDAIVGLSEEGKIEAHVEQHKDWLVRVPLQERPVAPAPLPERLTAPAPEQKSTELLTLKPTFYGISIDLKEGARRLRLWLRRRWGQSS